MAFVSKVTWLQDGVNAAGYRRALVRGEYSGAVSYKPHQFNIAVGDMVNVGLEVRFDKANKREYYNFNICGHADMYGDYE